MSQKDIEARNIGIGVLGIFLLLYVVFYIANGLQNQKSASSAYFEKSSDDKAQYQRIASAYSSGDYPTTKHLMDTFVQQFPTGVYTDSVRLLQPIVAGILFKRDSLAQIEMEQKMKDRAAALQKMAKKTDEFRGITFYRDKTSPRYVDTNGFFWVYRRRKWPGQPSS